MRSASTRGTPSGSKAGSLTRRLLAGVVVLSAALPATAQQITVYRCVDEAGRVALQDHPCPPGREAARRTVAAEADSAPAAWPSPPADAPAVTAAPATPMEAPIRTPPPELWLCVDFEGKQRFTARPERNGRYVPLWVVGGSRGGPRGLAGRAGQPLPGFADARAPVAPSGDGSALVYVQDQCFLLPPEQACRRYRDQRAEIERKRSSRTGEERRQMEAESARLLDILRNACG